jgi:hypothetical protein
MNPELAEAETKLRSSIHRNQMLSMKNAQLLLKPIGNQNQSTPAPAPAPAPDSTSFSSRVCNMTGSASTVGCSTCVSGRKPQNQFVLPCASSEVVPDVERSRSATLVGSGGTCVWRCRRYLTYGVAGGRGSPANQAMPDAPRFAVSISRVYYQWPRTDWLSARRGHSALHVPSVGYVHPHCKSQRNRNAQQIRFLALQNGRDAGVCLRCRY